MNRKFRYLLPLFVLLASCNTPSTSESILPSDTIVPSTPSISESVKETSPSSPSESMLPSNTVVPSTPSISEPIESSTDITLPPVPVE